MAIRYRVDLHGFDGDDDPRLLGIYEDRKAALAAAAASLAALPQTTLPSRYIVFPTERGSLLFRHHEILLARRVVEADEARARAAAIVKRFDDGWATISSLAHFLREQARTELVEAIAGGITAYG